MNGVENMSVEDIDRELAARGMQVSAGYWSNDCPMIGAFASAAFDALGNATTKAEVLTADATAREACRQMTRQAAAFRLAAAALRERNPFLLRHEGAGCCATEVRLLLNRAGAMDMHRAMNPDADAPDPAPVLARISAEFDAAAVACEAWAESLSVMRENRSRVPLAIVLAQVADRPRVKRHLLDACGREVIL
jgi:hypothetical protein